MGNLNTVDTGRVVPVEAIAIEAGKEEAVDTGVEVVSHSPVDTVVLIVEVMHQEEVDGVKVTVVSRVTGAPGIRGKEVTIGDTRRRKQLMEKGHGARKNMCYLAGKHAICICHRFESLVCVD